MPTPQLNITLVDTYSLDTIGFADISNYQGQVIKNVSFEISAPGFNKVNVFFTPESVNLYNSADLNIDCSGGAIPDGVYTVKYSANNESVEKYFMVTRNIILSYQELVLSCTLNCDCPPKSTKTLQDIKILIEGSIAASNKSQIDVAYKLYGKASELLSRQKNCNC
jgi:hypothetical protein